MKLISRRKFLVGSLCASLAAVLAYSRWWEPDWLKVRYLSFSKSAHPHRIVHFTDLHHKGDRGYLERVVHTINTLKADFVCFTGDIVEEASFLTESLKLMRQIRAPLYGVPGNHDYWADIDFDAVAECFAATGGKWLMDQTVSTPDKQVNVIGVTCNKAPDVRPVPGAKNVLLFHYPAWVSKLSSVQFDLMLAGHSHGGQVRLPFYGSLLVPFGVGHFDMGLYQTPAGPLYVNPGIGYFYCNVRFCCRPEITVINL